MNVVNQYGEKRNSFTEVVPFCHVMCRYYDRFLLQGVDRNRPQACFFYLAPGLICNGYWQVNSRRSIFRIADPSCGIANINICLCRRICIFVCVYIYMCTYVCACICVCVHVYLSLILIISYTKEHCLHN